MAGMDWFRWHHGSVTEPKFQLVARKSGASLPDVLAVWAYILETASQSVERGDFGSVDCEALDCLFNFPPTDSRTEAILKAMEGRGLTVGSRIQAWDKRQPKREREDNTNAERQAAFRAKQNQVTPSNTKKHLEESRGEEILIPPPTGGCPIDPAGQPDPEPPQASKSPGKPLPDCPYKRLLELWEKHLPHLTQPRVWEGNRKATMRCRWQQAAKPSSYSPKGYATEAEGVGWWDGFFSYVANETKLADGFDSNGRTWKPDLEWVCNAANFQKIIDGKYAK